MPFKPPTAKSAPKHREHEMHALYSKMLVLTRANALDYEGLSYPLAFALQKFYAAEGVLIGQVHGEQARFVAATGTLCHMTQSRLPLTQPTLQQFMTSEEARYFTPQSLAPYYIEWSLHAKFEALLVSPIIVASQPFGLVAIISSQKGVLKDEDREGLWQIAKFLAMLIENAQERQRETALQQFEKMRRMSAQSLPLLQESALELLQNHRVLRQAFLEQKYQAMGEALSQNGAYLEEMMHALQRLQELDQLCQSQVESCEKFSVSALLEQLCEYHRKQIEVVAELVFERSESKLEIMGDARLLWQALHELLLNALLAMQSQQAQKHQLTLRCYSHFHMVFIEVIDSGPGLEAAHRHKLFEPFFSTWPKHSGLGLCKALFNVLQLGGTLELYPAQARGCIASLAFRDEQHCPMPQVF